MLREVVTIDEKLCDGCGLCVPACHEGALRIVGGKARLVSDRLCDGLGACLGHCPRGAIRVQRREAAAFDENAVTHAVPATGCPGSRFAQFSGAACPTGATFDESPAQPSALRHWPVQLRLLPPGAPVLRGARLLVCADCVPVAYADFQRELLKDHAVVIACPKLDDTRGYVEKLAAMIAENSLAEITVARMEVPCCGGILQAVVAARELAGSTVPIHDVVISTRGELLARRQLPANAAVPA